MRAVILDFGFRIADLKGIEDSGQKTENKKLKYEKGTIDALQCCGIADGVYASGSL